MGLSANGRVCRSRSSSSPNSWPSSKPKAHAALRTTRLPKRGPFFGFSRTAYGLVKTRTDGHRFFVYTDSGNVQMKEAYAYQLDSSGVPNRRK